MNGISTVKIDKFQSTPSAWRVTLARQQREVIIPISIHTLRMEGDVRPLFFAGLVAISIHTLRMEGDVVMNRTSFPKLVFQSTPSAWRVTDNSDTGTNHFFHFNPHPPRGG